MKTALDKLLALRNEYDLPFKRKPGWDQKVRAAIIDIVVEDDYGPHVAQFNTRTEAFLESMIAHYVPEPKP